MPKKEKSPWAQIGTGGRRNEHPRRDKGRVVQDSPPLPSLPFHPVVSRFFIFRYSLYQLAENRPSSPRAARRARKQVGDFAEAKIEKRRLLPALAHYSLVPTSRFAFYITFILLHFSRDKCLRGFASRLGKCFHNVLLCRSLLVPPHLASLRREPLVSFFARARGTEE